ncbi:protein arginine N-methyltransferase PRMT10 [Physcomitrium patens]|uniref:Protein arginine N-methyltransferase PRMT10 n=1 Tax=Physcomitrium patens TaxID=3218 RepID=A0A2K1K1K3_PHYPA|nr:protein arginine N-methyltransferase PRMT10-like [Physcomitrium patens]PNR47651.1 hypothetical protein PHYPA_012124 [Physcomitrium patens]|eukprot:XP_024383890.1 protein arginine N-methyltransferase PRMT10-like [Physcomitrella patens]
MNGHGNGGCAAAGVPRAAFGKADKGADFANYFCTYAFLYHQKEMLSDRVRMDAYYDSIFKNARHFKGKTVLDVGTGSGILAIWSAQAGARKVYAVEATDMATHARALVAGNKMENVVEVIEGSVEDISLPEQVDIIISEWMGYFLVRESMFDSVIYARDKWLKPTGMMYPSHARMWLAPMQTNLGERKMQEYQHAMDDWSRFTQETLDQYGVDMGVLNTPYRAEQQKYFLQTSVWNNLHPNQIIGEPALVKEFDCLKATLEHTASLRSQFRIPIDPGNLQIAGFAGWFDVHFRGCASDAADNDVELTTAPSVSDTTHWGQQVFLLHPPINTRNGDVLVGELEVTRSKQNHRLMDVKVVHNLERRDSPPAQPTISQFHIE